MVDGRGIRFGGCGETVDGRGIKFGGCGDTVDGRGIKFGGCGDTIDGRGIKFLPLFGDVNMSVLWHERKFTMFH